MRSPITLALILVVAASGLLAGCSSGGSNSSWCCRPGDPTPSTQAACRCGPTCVWPPEKGTLDPGEVQLTPSLNKALCCPSFRDRYRYTRAPFSCFETERRYQPGER